MNLESRLFLAKRVSPSDAHLVIKATINKEIYSSMVKGKEIHENWQVKPSLSLCPLDTSENL